MNRVSCALAVLALLRPAPAASACHYGIAALVAEGNEFRVELVPEEIPHVFAGREFFHRGDPGGHWFWRMELLIVGDHVKARTKLSQLYEATCQGTFDSSGRTLRLRCRNENSFIWGELTWQVFYSLEGPTYCDAVALDDTEWDLLRPGQRRR